MKRICIIGGGAAGMTAAIFLARKGANVTLLERGERLGRKLSATGNGQGNVTNLEMGEKHYFSDDPAKVARALARFGCRETIGFFEELGGFFLPDERGRVYPASRQASAVTDLLRRELARLNVTVVLQARVREIEYHNGFSVRAEAPYFADGVVLAAGGRAAPNFGTDGSAYALAEKFGHTVTPCSPVLVRLKSDPALVRGLKGIRLDACVAVCRGEKTLFSCRGDVLFTENGVSGDAVFRASSYAKAGDELRIDLLPDVPAERLIALLARDPSLLCVVNNGLGRALLRRANGDMDALLRLLKRFSLPVTGTLGYDCAQVTRGGIPLSETDDCLMSRMREGLFFAGEILNVDGECGGYNLQWAFTSAYLAAEGALR